MDSQQASKRGKYVVFEVHVRTGHLLVHLIRRQRRTDWRELNLGHQVADLSDGDMIEESC